MNTITNNRSEWILAAAIALEIFDLCFPTILPALMVNTFLFIGVLGFILNRLQGYDNTLKHKYWR